MAGSNAQVVLGSKNKKPRISAGFFGGENSVMKFSVGFRLLLV